MTRFDGQGVVITGGAQGMGRAIADAFVAEGARVVLGDLNEDGVKRTAAELGGGDVAIGLRCNVTSAREVESFVDAAVEHLGSVDVFVNNAGTITMSRMTEISEDDWDMVMDVNAKGVFLCTRAIVPHMLERKSGAIVNIASQAGKRGYKLFTHYCASKAAVIVFTKGVALEIAPDVRINCVCPGIVNTDMMEREYEWEQAMTGESKDSIKERWMSGIPMGRFQEPERVARLALFLASDDASEMTGQAVNITGGMIME
jgi:NAD(P)-dependent dehydrogenase (short-subunit alcohol dehydrogenase family)